VTITVSIGVAMAVVECSEDQLPDRADAVMVRAKREGATSVVFAG
jgi:GGDEF domain-containing protein